jgi:hypothetical protein
MDDAARLRATRIGHSGGPPLLDFLHLTVDARRGIERQNRRRPGRQAHLRLRQSEAHERRGAPVEGIRQTVATRACGVPVSQKQTGDDKHR